MRLFDSVSRSVVALPVKAVLSWYSCGPTVYDKTHLGHARNYVQVDIVQRVAEALLGTQVMHVMNVTDVDDKILQRAALLGVAPQQLARENEREFATSMAALGVRPPVMMTRVTEHIAEIVAYVETIVAAGMAYVIPGDGVYFDTKKLGAERYQLLGGAQPVEGDKADFVLWKTKAEGTEAMGWSSPWGFGRPGWHIECSAMIDSAFGSGAKLDVHSGGIDLAFPHHNNEIAQSCARHGGCSHEQLFGVFMHVGHLHIEGLKMSKSLKNFVTVEDFLADGVSPDVFRMFCLLHSYRTNTNYSPAKIEDAANVLEKLCRFVADNREYAAFRSCHESLRWTDEDRAMWRKVIEFGSVVRELLAEDVQTQEAIHVMLRLISDVNKFAKGTARSSMLVAKAVQIVAGFLDIVGVSKHLPRAEADSRADRIAQAAVDVRAKIKEFGTGLPKPHQQQCFQMADWARDVALANAGLVVKDGRNNAATWHWKD